MTASATPLPPLRTYMVGGAVRDRLLGLPVHDRDWVVVGATPEDMAARGFVPVGKDFPVFLHPQTREEYALARTERKSAPGYRGFAVQASPAVTLEEDLARRDLTINAIAAPANWAGDEAALIDPFGGLRDLRAGVLRHVTDAFREDPVRILRLARFAARFHAFSIAPETQALLRSMVQAGEAAHLVPERVWQELARGLMQPRPSRMLHVLHSCGALAAALPELAASYITHGPRLERALDEAARLNAPLPARYACLTADIAPAALAGLHERLRPPADCQALADLLTRQRPAIEASAALPAAALVDLLQAGDALRRPARFEQALLACECVARAEQGGKEAGCKPGGPAPSAAPWPPRQRLLAALAAAQSVDAAAIARQAAASGARGVQIGQALRAARVQVVQTLAGLG